MDPWTIGLNIILFTVFLLIVVGLWELYIITKERRDRERAGERGKDRPKVNKEEKRILLSDGE